MDLKQILSMTHSTSERLSKMPQSKSVPNPKTLTRDAADDS